MRYFPAEFEPQSFVQLIFPHPQSDWAPYLEEARGCFVNIANAVARYQPCLIVCDDVDFVKTYFQSHENLIFIPYQSDDTWARDCSVLSVIDEDEDEALLLDFTFTGWGGKFDASRDNAMSSAIADVYSAPVQTVDLILEGGGVETNANGSLLTTAECLLNPNRNPHLDKKGMEKELKKQFGVEQILWLNHGYLAGDDTDSHIDTLARFIDTDTIMYVKCDDQNDEHYEALKKMETELKALRDIDGETFKLIALPMCNPTFYDEERLPATYANFLIINDAVLLPVYNDPHDNEAIEICTKAFHGRDIIPIDCSVLIRQHGSLHCVTMQFPEDIGLRVE
ncbi:MULTISPECIES: agmatine deiminase family protein [unclassified Sulfuricurvum]|uniref:agmatine deiminase family protein n=1 Tax=unclassified Sulfuricurvum TaxID=2632390 RepID=UPI0002998AF4|nr:MULTISPECIES: agmatine deiminase family protein [unclassified Sulfuricurvum]AFV98367.1 agmatine deiminase [Candidatus Sulfuricurvum sp. RIFRC-1]HBM36556.1 agmatine deiminase family protein [Sulfuricurvum sp.]